MKRLSPLNLICILCFLCLCFSAQNETKKWYFGSYAGLDFMTNPPTVLTGSMLTQNNCTSMADANGNLLFYSNGIEVWNQNHQIMANGAGLNGNTTLNTQGVVAIKKPGSSNLYYLFTTNPTGSIGYRYTVIDMSLAAGMGSVTIKNALLWDTNPQTSGSRITVVKHCNDIDYWITCHTHNTTEFRSYLLSATGVNTVGVVSTVGDVLSGFGAMRFSSNGKKIALATYTTSPFTSTINVHDFDNSTGSVSANSIRITNCPKLMTGMEFSSDGTKLYGANSLGVLVNSLCKIYQWDLCAGNEPAVNASSTELADTTLATVGSTSLWFMQLGPDGKIYICSDNNANNLIVVNQPNLAGIACGFSLQSQPQLPGTNTGRSGTHFPASYFRNLNASLEAIINCQQVQFNVPNHAQTINGCAATNYPLLATVWDFGDTASTTNTSTIANPSHFYTAPGTYTSQVILQYNCRADTFKKVITIDDANPTFSISGRSTICVGETSTLSTNGNSTSYTYSWSTGATTSSIVPISTNTITTNFTVVVTDTNNCVTTKIIQFKVNKCTGFTELNDKSSVSIYPNPAKESIKIETSETLSLTIFNNVGQLILQKEKVSNGEEIDLGSLPEGLYFVRLSNGVWSDVKPLIKE